MTRRVISCLPNRTVGKGVAAARGAPAAAMPAETWMNWRLVLI